MQLNDQQVLIIYNQLFLARESGQLDGPSWFLVNNVMKNAKLKAKVDSIHELGKKAIADFPGLTERGVDRKVWEWVKGEGEDFPSDEYELSRLPMKIFEGVKGINYTALEPIIELPE
jgi:hypothetical protein